MAGAAVPMYNITACRIDLRANMCSGSSTGLQQICVKTLGIFGVSLPSQCTSAHLGVWSQIYVRTDGNRVLEWNICKQHNLSIHFGSHSRQYYYDFGVLLN